MKTNILTSALVLGLAFAVVPHSSAASPAETKAIASDAYIYGYAMLYNYKTLFQQAIDCVVAMLPSSRRQLTVMVNSNFASSSIGQRNIAWPPSIGPQVFTDLDLSAIDSGSALRRAFP